MSPQPALWPMLEQVTQHSIEVKCIFLDVNLDQRYGRGEDEFWETTDTERVLWCFEAETTCTVNTEGTRRPGLRAVYVRSESQN